MARCIRAVKYLQSQGYMASIGESEYNGRKHDLFGFADILAHGPSVHTTADAPFPFPHTVLVQVTTLASMHLRMLKIEASVNAYHWLDQHSSTETAIRGIAVLGYNSGVPIPSNAPTYGLPKRVRLKNSLWILDPIQSSASNTPAAVYCIESMTLPTRKSK